MPYFLRCLHGLELRQFSRFLPVIKPIQKSHKIIISFGQEQDQAKEKIAMFFQNCPIIDMIKGSVGRRVETGRRRDTAAETGNWPVQV